MQKRCSPIRAATGPCACGFGVEVPRGNEKFVRHGGRGIFCRRVVKPLPRRVPPQSPVAWPDHRATLVCWGSGYSASAANAFVQLIQCMYRPEWRSVNFSNPCKKTMDTENKHYVDLWMKQSKLFWQTVYQFPVIAGALFAGWFALKSAAQDSLAQGLLCIGMLSMVVQILILKRMAQYLVTFRQAADRLIPNVPPAIAGMSGYILGAVVPILIMVFFVALFFWSPSFKTPPSQTTPTANNALDDSVSKAMPASLGVTPIAPSQLTTPDPLLKGTSAGKPMAVP